MQKHGFTLIELSIVLIIIGLIVGGVLVGKDLISAAQIRAQVSQLEKYQTAANTFRLKYGYLPGDIPATAANGFGFQARGPNAGQGDGNGVLEMYSPINCINGPGTTVNSCGWAQGGGETAMFWSDLTYANGMNLNLIPGSFSSVTITSTDSSTITAAQMPLYFPQAALGKNTFIYAGSRPNNGRNFFGVVGNISFGFGSCSVCIGTLSPTISAREVYSIDTKIDDGLPLSGHVIAFAPISSYGWANGQGSNTDASVPGSPSATSCFDNGGNAANPTVYSLKINDGNKNNCWFSILFQ